MVEASESGYRPPKDMVTVISVSGATGLAGERSTSIGGACGSGSATVKLALAEASSVLSAVDITGELSLHRGTKAEARCLVAGNLQSAPPEDLRKLRNL